MPRAPAASVGLAMRQISAAFDPGAREGCGVLMAPHNRGVDRYLDSRIMRQRRACLCSDSKHRPAPPNEADVAGRVRSMAPSLKTQKMPLKKTRGSFTPQHDVRLISSIGLITSHPRSVSTQRMFKAPEQGITGYGRSEKLHPLRGQVIALKSAITFVASFSDKRHNSSSLSNRSATCPPSSLS